MPMTLLIETGGGISESVMKPSTTRLVRPQGPVGQIPPEELLEHTVTKRYPRGLPMIGQSEVGRSESQSAQDLLVYGPAA